VTSQPVRFSILYCGAYLKDAVHALFEAVLCVTERIDQRKVLYVWSILTRIMTRITPSAATYFCACLLHVVHRSLHARLQLTRGVFIIGIRSVSFLDRCLGILARAHVSQSPSLGSCGGVGQLVNDVTALTADLPFHIALTMLEGGHALGRLLEGARCGRVLLRHGL
jgi:hypothetical protein